MRFPLIAPLNGRTTPFTPTAQIAAGFGALLSLPGEDFF